MTNLVSKLALGTVQFGLKYGVSHEGDRVSLADTSALLKVAKSLGIDTLDTACAYGDAHLRLGKIGVEGFSVVTKLPPDFERDADIKGTVEISVDGILRDLDVNHVDCLMLHRAEPLMSKGSDRIFRVLDHQRDCGRCRKIGISASTPDEVMAVIDRHPIDVVQLPFNVLDIRLVHSGLLEELVDAGIEVHTRSAFLQGLLLMKPDARPSYFGQFSHILTQWDDWLAGSGQSALSACLGFALGQKGIDKVVFGCENVEQLKEIADVAESQIQDVPQTLSCDNQALINPALWRLP